MDIPDDDEAINVEDGHFSPDNYPSNRSSECDSGSNRSTSIDRDRDEERTLEEDTYIKFVNSVFFDDDIFSGYSNPSDEDDDENYEPECKDENDDDDDDDDDDDLVRVQNRELRELVDGCWQTIAGEAPNIVLAANGDGSDSVTANTALNEGNLCLKHASIRYEDHCDDYHDDEHPDGMRRLDNSELNQHLQLLANATSTVVEADNNSSDNNITVAINHDLDHPDALNYHPRAKPSLITGTGQSAISHLVTKIFSGSEPADVCVDGAPVQAIRKLVARQLSMAAQLLVQVLLQADDRSDCFTKGYTSLVGLSNLRDAALRKATLVQMNVDNAQAIKNKMATSHECLSLKSSTPSNYCEFGNYAEHQVYFGGGHAVAPSILHNDEPLYRSVATHPSNVPNPERRLTRSSLALSGALRSTHSMLDVPVLSRIALLFSLIDQSRQKIKHQQLQLQLRAIPDPNSLLRSYSLSAIKQEVQSLVPQMNMRLWTCLLPTANYPLPHALFAATDPGSLTGRCLFTPAEDDLLLRGAHSTDQSHSPQAATHSMWDGVRALLLPNKEAQLLQFRYSQMVSLTTAAVEENNFRKFIRCETEYNARDRKWTHAEELDLLRGFQLFGERWPLIKMFFLPHRRTHQIRIRWQGLQSIWNKAYRGQHGPAARATFSGGELSSDLVTFLTDINRSLRDRGSTASKTAASIRSSINHTSDQRRHYAASFYPSDATMSGPRSSLPNRSAEFSQYSDYTIHSGAYDFMNTGAYPTNMPLSMIDVASNIADAVSPCIIGPSLDRDSVLGRADGMLSGWQLSGPPLLKNVPSQRYARQRKNHRAYMRNAVEAIHLDRSDDDVQRTALVSVDEVANLIDPRLNNTQEVDHLETKVSLDSNEVVELTCNGPSSASGGDSLERYFECAEIGGHHQTLDQLMNESESFMALLNDVECFTSGSDIDCAVGARESKDLNESASFEQQQTMTMSVTPITNSPHDTVNSDNNSHGARLPETRSTVIHGDPSLTNATQDIPRMLKPRKKTIKPTRIAANRGELHMLSGGFDAELSTASAGASKAIHMDSSQGIAVPVEQSVEASTPNMSTVELSPVDSTAAIHNNSTSCGWSLLDDMSFLQREGTVWIEHSEWTRFQEHQSVVSNSDQGDPHLMLLHDMSALEAPGGTGMLSMSCNEHLFENDGVQTALSESRHHDQLDGMSSLMGGIFLPDELCASRSGFCDISQFVSFLKPTSTLAVNASAVNAVDTYHELCAPSIDINNRRIHSNDTSVDPSCGEHLQKKQKLGIFATVMASSKSSRAALQI